MIRAPGDSILSPSNQNSTYVDETEEFLKNLSTSSDKISWT